MKYTKPIMTVSSAFLGVAGIALSFFPQEVSEYLIMNGGSPIILQIMGALYFGFALINWTARANATGGIYSRPVAIGNFSHFTMGALALIKLSLNGIEFPHAWIAAFLYSAFALLFGYVFFTSPVMKSNYSIDTARSG